jgi:adenylyltransferase/sulfurtransferase
MTELTSDELRRYSRHLLIPEVGLAGQQRLKDASVLVVGTGGLGSPVSLYLAAAGVGRIGLVDYDRVDESNLQRQIVHGTSTLGLLKVESARRRLLDLNPCIQVDVYDQPFTSANARETAAPYDVFVDGTDNFPTRYLLNDLAVFLGRPLVYGSIYRFDGQVSVFDARRGPCYRCLFPVPPPPGSVPSCAEGGVLGVLPGVIGALQAGEALKLLLGIGDPLVGRLLLYNGLDLTFETIRLKKNPHCRVCSPEADIKELVDYDEFCGLPAHGQPAPAADEARIMTPEMLASRLNGDQPPLLLDVRDPHELQISSLPGAMNIPLGQLPARLAELDPAREIVVFCRTGSRSERAAILLASSGFAQVHNLQGGINAWARSVDHSLPQY